MAKASTSKGGVLRGVALVERVLGIIAEEGGKLPSNRMLEHPKQTDPKPLDPALLAKLTLADGKPLPPSLARWLAFDGSWLPLDIDKKKARLKAKRFSTLLEEGLSGSGASFPGVDEALLPGDCYRLLAPTLCNESASVFLYAGEPDELGELPVLGVDFQDSGILGVFACGFDVYLGRIVDAVPPVDYALGEGPKGYEAWGRKALEKIAGKDHKKRIFDGVIGLLPYMQMDEEDD